MGGPLQTGQFSSKSVRWLVPPPPGPIVDALLTGLNVDGKTQCCKTSSTLTFFAARFSVPLRPVVDIVEIVKYAYHVRGKQLKNYSNSVARQTIA